MLNDQKIKTKGHMNLSEINRGVVRSRSEREFEEVGRVACWREFAGDKIVG